MANKYKTDLEQARIRLAELLRRREILDIQIAKQQRQVASLATLADESEETDQVLEMGLGGLTEACRTVLRAAGNRGLEPMEVRKELRHFHFPIDEYSNAMASIHTVLKRLVESGEVRIAIHDRGDEKDSSVYQWVGSLGSEKRNAPR